jgi:hypothetical protein
MNLDSKFTNLGSRKFARLALIAGAIWIALVCAYLLFFAYEWIWGTEKGRKQLPALESELAQIKAPNSDSVVSKSSNYKSTSAIVSKKFLSSQKWEALREFYVNEMRALGWTHTESKKVLEWKKDFGGQIEDFRKGSYDAELFYLGPNRGYQWTYGLSISIDLPLFGEKK